MPQNFTDKNTAQRWDSNTAYSNPTRPEQLDLMLTIIEDAYQPGDTILDLGFGSGLVEEMIFRRIPDVHVVGVDASPAMMALAAERLHPYASQYTAIFHDLRMLDSLPLEKASFPFIISIQALHHLTDAEMKVTYRAIHDLLKPGGLFLLLDRIHIDQPGLFSVYQSFWRWQDSRYQSHVAEHEGTDYHDHLKRNQDRGDNPLSLEHHLVLMREVGLDANCLNAHGVRALFAARKPGV